MSCEKEFKNSRLFKIFERKCLRVFKKFVDLELLSRTTIIPNKKSAEKQYLQTINLSQNHNYITKIDLLRETFYSEYNDSAIFRSIRRNYPYLFPKLLILTLSIKLF